MGSTPSPRVAILGSALAIVVAVPALRLHFPEYLPANSLPIATVFFLVVYTFYTLTLYPRFFSPLRSLPQPEGALPILGHGLVQFQQPRGQIFLEWSRSIPNDGFIRFPGLFNTDCLLLTSPAVLKEVLVTKSYIFEKESSWRSYLRFFLGNGLLVVEGDDHKNLRKQLLPAFAFRHIKELYPVFWGKSGQMANEIAKQISKDEKKGTNGFSMVDITYWATQVTMDIIGLATMGLDFHTVQGDAEEAPLSRIYKKMLEPTIGMQIYTAIAVTTSPELLRKLPLPINKRLFEEKASLVDVCLDLVRKKHSLLEMEPEGHKDILSVCLKGTISDKQMVDQLLTFLAAGHETTASALTWTAHVLARDQSLQSRLRAEIHANLPAPGESIPEDIVEVLESLPLLNAICNETLRYYPTIPLTLRIATEDTSLLNHLIPKGTQIFICPWSTNRDPDLWADADEFIPERWIDVDDVGVQRANNHGGAHTNYAGLTFLHGPRSCIGEGFSKAEMRCIVALLVGEFEMELEDPNKKIEIGGVVSMRAKDPMEIKLKKNGQWKASRSMKS